MDPDAFLRLAAAPVDRAALESALRGTPLDPEDGDDGRYVFANAQHYDVMAGLGLDAPGCARATATCPGGGTCRTRRRPTT